MVKFTPAEFNLKAFNCPYCGVYARQSWGWVGYTMLYNGGANASEVDDDCYVTRSSHSQKMQILNGINISVCEHCHKFSIWIKDRLMLPPNLNVDPPHEDMPASVSTIYHEAAEIVDASPRGAAALLRVALEQLTHELGCDPDNRINEKIGELVAKGVSPDVTKACDVLRVTGNNAAHPAETLLLDDNRDTAISLFQIINYIVEQTISHAKRLADMHNRLPEGVRLQIDKRNLKALPKGD
ncbi:protein of unknown function [Paracoccus alcaliphilus]|uniref:DUF4145 domain-containing protein n=2 Tax=Paracoccus alcaliphilus TaxID=34002 RepID=A0A1H8NMF9_9RHOB|nr:protein of unknown function [Paracoccus alcaliphilus]